MRCCKVLVPTFALVTGVLYYLAATPVSGNAKQSKAQLGAKVLADACEAYYLTPDAQNQFPKALADLVNPPFKCERLLKNGEHDLIDPWGKPYQYELRTKSDGTQYPFVSTVSDKGVAISQFGIGPKAEPPF